MVLNVLKIEWWKSHQRHYLHGRIVVVIPLLLIGMALTFVGSQVWLTHDDANSAHGPKAISAAVGSEHAENKQPASKKPESRARSRWGANYFPNVPLVMHNGKTVHFYDDLLKDKAVAINFIYTSCPNACRLETARLLQVQKLLGDRVGRDIFFYSITIDPKHDTPEVLKRYAEKFKTGPGWYFLTGKEDDINRLRRKLGVYTDRIQADGSLGHNLSLIIGNEATGRWMRRSPYENSGALASMISDWLHN